MTARDMSVAEIPSLGFARGVVVRRRGDGRNMLVVRGLGAMTACIVVEGNADGQLRLREYPTGELVQVLGLAEGPVDNGVPDRGPDAR